LTYPQTELLNLPRTEHLVQLFDDSDSRAAAVSRFVADGLRQGDSLLIVITRDNWNEVVGCLRSIGAAWEEAMESGQLSVRDASAAMASVMRNGRPDRDLFNQAIATLVSQLNSRDRHLRIYGEIVDLLAAEGNYRSAQQLEELWNELGRRETFTLFCGYAAANFGDPGTAGALQQICRAHSRVRSNPRDVLGTFLIHAHTALPGRASQVSH
jgi:phosphatidylserine/phosphatidylglycerophosphate/cardiolipin synthase-like enzyme